jgi:hypothetical protein
MVWHHWPTLHIWCLDIVMPGALEAHAHGAVTWWPSAHMAIMCKCLCIMWWLFIGAIALADAADIESARTTIANFRIIAVLPSSVCARQGPNSLRHLSHWLALHSWNLALRGKNHTATTLLACARFHLGRSEHCHWLPSARPLLGNQSRSREILSG